MPRAARVKFPAGQQQPATLRPEMREADGLGRLMLRLSLLIPLASSLSFIGQVRPGNFCPSLALSIHGQGAPTPIGNAWEVFLQAHLVVAGLIICGVAAWRVGLKGVGDGIIGDIVIGVAGSLVAAWIFPSFLVTSGFGIVDSTVAVSVGAVMLMLFLRLLQRHAGLILMALAESKGGESTFGNTDNFRGETTTKLVQNAMKAGAPRQG